MTGHPASIHSRRQRVSGMAIELFGACVLPGCQNVVTEPTEPCADCVAAFGPMLRPTAAPITVGDVEARDTYVRDAYRKQREVAAGPLNAEQERKAMQLCWLCEERRTCTRTANGWECGTCGQVR